MAVGRNDHLYWRSQRLKLLLCLNQQTVDRKRAVLHDVQQLVQHPVLHLLLECQQHTFYSKTHVNLKVAPEGGDVEVTAEKSDFDLGVSFGFVTVALTGDNSPASVESVGFLHVCAELAHVWEDPPLGCCPAMLGHRAQKEVGGSHSGIHLGSLLKA